MNRKFFAASLSAGPIVSLAGTSATAVSPPIAQRCRRVKCARRPEIDRHERWPVEVELDRITGEIDTPFQSRGAWDPSLSGPGRLGRSGSPEWLHPCLESRDQLCEVDLAVDEVDDGLDDVVVGRFDLEAVELEENERGEDGDPLVPVDERVIAGQRFQQRGGLVGECWIGILAERALSWTLDRGLQEAAVA